MGLGRLKSKTIWAAHSYHLTATTKYNIGTMITVIDVTVVLKIDS